MYLELGGSFSWCGHLPPESSFLWDCYTGPRIFFFILHLLNASLLLVTISSCTLILPSCLWNHLNLLPLSSNPSCKHSPRNRSLHIQHQEIPLHMSRSSCSQALACCPRIPWRVLYQSHAPVWCCSSKQQHWYDWQCHGWHLESRGCNTYPEIWGWS